MGSNFFRAYLTIVQKHLNVAVIPGALQHITPAQVINTAVAYMPPIGSAVLYKTQRAGCPRAGLDGNFGAQFHHRCMRTAYCQMQKTLWIEHRVMLRKKRLLEQLKKRRASTEHPARQTREQAERANRTERANRDRGRENAHNAERRPEGGHDRDRRADINELERKIDEAKRAGRHEEAEKLMRHFRQMREPSERGKREESEEAERRVAHLREAAELLGAIGKREESEKLRHEAAAIERRLQQHHRDRGHNEGPSNAELAKAVHGLQEQIQELHQAILEIQKHLNKKR